VVGNRGISLKKKLFPSEKRGKRSNPRVRDRGNVGKSEYMEKKDRNRLSKRAENAVRIGKEIRRKTIRFLQGIYPVRIRLLHKKHSGGGESERPDSRKKVRYVVTNKKQERRKGAIQPSGFPGADRTNTKGQNRFNGRNPEV